MVYCLEGFWKRGNIQTVCNRYRTVLVETIEELKEQVRERLEVIVEKCKKSV